MTSHIARAAKEGRMAKGGKPGVAQQEIEGTGEDRIAQQLDPEDGIDAYQRRCNQARQQQAIQNVFRTIRHGQPHTSLPNKPAGRTSRTSAMMKNTTVDEACG